MSTTDLAPASPAPPRSRSDAEDRDLVFRVIAGDQRASGELFARYRRRCCSLAGRILGDDGLAEDVVQEVFFTLWRDARRYDERRGTVATYLLTMTRFKAVDAVRKEDNHRRRREAAEVVDGRRDPTVDVADDVWQRARIRSMRTALAQLPAVEREALLLAYYAGYTQQEIARLRAIPLGTVKTRTARGKRRLRRALERMEGR